MPHASTKMLGQVAGPRQVGARVAEAARAGGDVAEQQPLGLDAAVEHAEDVEQSRCG